MLPFNSRPFHMIIPAAGSGVRVGGDVPKQYQRIAGKPILRHTLEKVLSWTGLQSVRVIINPEHEALFKQTIEGLIPIPFVLGGKTRKQSVSNALEGFSNIKNEDIVLIHDAARPLVQWDDVQDLLNAFTNYNAATLASPVSDTLRNSPKTLKVFNSGSAHNTAGKTIDRSDLWSIQTPQAFYYGDIKAAHEAFKNDNTYTDDTGVISAHGIEVALVRGARSNIKITTQEDMIMAEALIHHDHIKQDFTSGKALQNTSQNAITTEVRTGFGYDVHAFQAAHVERAHAVAPDQSFEHSFTTHTPVRPLVLCGVRVAHDVGLKGHSDADVGLHALVDALLGAIGEGDIGYHFPPSDKQYKDMDSRIFVEKTVDMVEDKGGVISNVDITLVCEEPKITPYRANMVKTVAEILGIARERVNVKATTTERLGFTGRGEGIAAHVVATVMLPLNTEQKEG